MSVSSYQQRIRLFYAYRQVLVDEGVIGSISEQPALEAGHNRFDDIIHSAEASQQLSEDAIAKIKAINTAYTEQDHIQLTDDVLAKIKSPNFNLPTSNILHSEIASAVTLSDKRKDQVITLERALEEKLHQSLGTSVDAGDIENLKKSVENKLTSILSKSNISFQDIASVQLTLGLYTAEKSSTTFSKYWRKFTNH